MWLARVAHTAQACLSRMDHTAWPKIPHARMVYPCGPHDPNQSSPCVAHGLPGH
ncbi:hypothetical protein PVK06_012046 [Gossypium arboreum]|uniref:Uncharacterized protein n=1 Tax=Gossypium arboreum TaxID=29729 RepID=A0ABR0QBD3_GOSAR|nr:hypothetical protein PVK06_012046 [Gossypium arboreum]